MARKRTTAKQRAAARRNIKKARKKWMSMSAKARRKAMPARRKGKFKRYPVGQYMLLDVGRKGHHYQYVKKTKYGWKKVSAPKGVKEIKKGYIYKTPAVGRAMTAAARRKWKKMSPAARAKAMPSWSAARKRRVRRLRPGGMK